MACDLLIHFFVSTIEVVNLPFIAKKHQWEKSDLNIYIILFS